MKCWCDEVVDYLCFQCESRKKMLRLSNNDKLLLKAYLLELKRGDANPETARRILEKNLCVSMIARNN